MDWKALRRAAQKKGFRLLTGQSAEIVANPNHPKGHKARAKRQRQNRKRGRWLNKTT